MNPTSETEQSFAETALRLGGKSEEEATRLGAMDKADEQVETLFAPQYQTVNSPIHKAIWEDQRSARTFLAAVPAGDCAVRSGHGTSHWLWSGAAVSKGSSSIRIQKISSETIEELAGAGYWGLLDRSKIWRPGRAVCPLRTFFDAHGDARFHDGGAGLRSWLHRRRRSAAHFRQQRTKGSFACRILASGEKISAFALTEPWAGSDLTASDTTAVPAGDHLEITGEKLFITNVLPGRHGGLVVLLEGKPAVVIAELPEENEQFQFVQYGLYALKHAYNRGMKFNKFRVPRENLLVPKTATA